MSHTSKKVHPMVQSNGRSLTPSPSPQPPTLSFTTSVLQKLGSIFKPEVKEETPKILQKKRAVNRTSSILRKTRESRRFSAGSLLAETIHEVEKFPETSCETRQKLLQALLRT